jgi:hypothetical protein
MMAGSCARPREASDNRVDNCTERYILKIMEEIDLRRYLIPDSGTCGTVILLSRQSLSAT